MPRFGKERLRLEPAKGVLCRWKRQERKRTLALLRSRLSTFSTACVDGGASSPARCRGSNFQFEPWQFCLQGKNAESCGFCASCHPPPVSAEILRISGRGNCKEAIFALGNGISRRKNRPVPDVHGRFCRFFKSSKSVGFSRLENPVGFQPAAGNDLSAKGLRPSRALPWVF